MYQVDPNDNLKMIPKNKIVKDAYGRATTPAAETIEPRPTHVLVNMNGTYAFAYQSGSADTYVTGSVNYHTNGNETDSVQFDTSIDGDLT